MQKEIALRCPSCGNTYTFNVGAGFNMSNWREVAALVPDKKEAEKINDLYVKLSEKRSKAAIKDLSRNCADALNNVCYETLGEDCVKLLNEEDSGFSPALIGEKAQETINSSKEKWQAASKKEGLTALQAIYICPKSRKPKQGLHITLRYKDEKGKDNVYTYCNRCNDCASNLTLADDGCIGLMHEDCVTSARCEKCSASLVVDKVSFKIPRKEETAEN